MRPLYVALWTVNGIFLAITLAAFLYADVGVDWDIYTEAGSRFFTGALYEWDGLPYRYSPLLAPLFAALAPIGYLGWSLLHFAALLTIPRKLALIALVSAPFWNDVYNGNTVTFVFVAAVWALRGKPWAFFVLAVLIPRPVMLPVLAWLLWRHREYVVPFVLIAVVSLLGAWMTGWVDEWVVGEIGNFGRDIYADIGPSMLIGAWWFPVGLGLAAYCTWRGWLGPASFLASGFWSLHYGIMLGLSGRALLNPHVPHDGSGGVLHRARPGAGGPADLEGVRRSSQRGGRHVDKANAAEDGSHAVLLPDKPQRAANVRSVDHQPHADECACG